MIARGQRERSCDGDSHNWFSPIPGVFQISFSESEVLINSPKQSSLGHGSRHVTSDRHVITKRGRKKKMIMFKRTTQVRARVLVKTPENLVMKTEICAWTESALSDVRTQVGGFHGNQDDASVEPPTPTDHGDAEPELE